MGAFVGTVNKIEEVGLENLVYAYVKNFKSLVPRSAYSVGDKVIFIEPDSVLPEAEWAETYRKYAPKRVKPIKLAGFLTEGLIVPVSGFVSEDVEDDTDVSAMLGVTHYEPPLPTDGNAVGRLPYWLPKTDEIRWEHLPIDAIVGKDRLVTLKIDGSSCTFVVHRDDDSGNVRVYSRSLEYDDDGTSKYSQVLDRVLDCDVTLRDEILDAAREYFASDEQTDAVVFRGELYGSNIQKRGKNPHAASPLAWACFGVYVYNNAELHKQDMSKAFCEEANIEVPSLVTDVTEDFITTVQEGGALTIAPEFYEGVVIHFPEYYYKGRMVSSCKVINKVYDSKI